MLLSVICSKTSKGINRMLEKELKGIEYEIIRNTWENGLLKAKGSYVCLLENDSAIAPGTLRNNLKVFTDNPSYRKLAMVSNIVDFPELPDTLIFSWSNGLKGYQSSQLVSMRDCRIGYVPGAIIRRTSLLKSNLDHIQNARKLTTDVSFDFWSRGLRICVNPETTYYAPENPKYRAYRDKFMPDDRVIKIWEHEMIL